jgi:branched-subunit amino acid transport protein
MWLTIFALGLGTYLLRASFLLGIEFFGGLPETVKSVLPLVPLAVLTALAAPYLALPDGSLSIHPANEQLVAGLAAFVVARITENLILTIAGGMAVLWTLQFL